MTEKKTDPGFKVMLSVSLSFPPLRLELQCLSQRFRVIMNWGTGGIPKNF